MKRSLFAPFLLTLIAISALGEAQNLPTNNRWGKFGEPFDKFHGVAAYSNVVGGKYQCTELVHRYYKTVYGVPTRIGLGLGHAKDLAQGIFRKFGKSRFGPAKKAKQMKLNLAKMSNSAPIVGSLISFDIGKFGHTAIARRVEDVNPTTKRVYLFEQHGLRKLTPGQLKPVRFIDFIKQGRQWKTLKKEEIGVARAWINMEAP